MKRLLKKRWLGLPVGIIAVILLVLALAGGTIVASGAFRVDTYETNIEVNEPLVVTEIQPPGEFWDWGDGQDEPREIVPQIVYAGQDLGATGIGGKYFILNLMPDTNPRGSSIPTQYISVTVTVEELTGQMEWYGIDIYPSSGWGATDSCNWSQPWVTSDAVSNVQTATFDMGNVTYPGDNVTPSIEILQDSNQVVIFIQGKVADGAISPGNLYFVLTVDRGS